MKRSDKLLLKETVSKPSAFASNWNTSAEIKVSDLLPVHLWCKWANFKLTNLLLYHLNWLC